MSVTYSLVSKEAALPAGFPEPACERWKQTRDKHHIPLTSLNLRPCHHFHFVKEAVKTVEMSMFPQVYVFPVNIAAVLCPHGCALCPVPLTLRDACKEHRELINTQKPGLQPGSPDLGPVGNSDQEIPLRKLKARCTRTSPCVCH